MRVLVWTSGAEPAFDIGVEEAILLAVDSGVSPPTLRFWAPHKPAVVIGTGQTVEREVNLVAAAEMGIPVLRRFSGGGAVVLGPGVWNYSAFMPYEMVPGSGTIGGTARAVIGWVASALSRLGVEAAFAGISDLAVRSPEGERKLAGHAQARKKRAFCLHGSLIVSLDADLVERLLPMPTEAPAYRNGRRHGDFMIGLRALGCSADFDEFCRAVASASGMETEWKHAPDAEELRRGAELAESKYSSAAWTFRR